MPSIRGPSMIAACRTLRAASVSSTMNSVDPWRARARAASRPARSATRCPRRGASRFRRGTAPRSRAGARSSRAPREDRVLDALAQLGVDVVQDRELPGVDDAHAHPALMAWYRNAECIASRTGSLPRNRQTLLRPPLTCTCGQAADLRRGLDEVRRARTGRAARCPIRRRRCSGRI